MASKSNHLGSRLEPKSHNKSQNDMPGPSLENNLQKVAHRLQTQTLQTMKSSVWYKRNHSFHHSSFPATCLEMWSQGSLIWNTFATQIGKRLSKQTSKTSSQTVCQKTQICYENGLVSFGFRGPFFKAFRTRIPLGH